MKRRINVPGSTLEMKKIIETGKNVIMACMHKGEMIILFLSPEITPTARSMTIEQARKFMNDVTEAHQALNDDEKIAEMEKEFEND